MKRRVKVLIDAEVLRLARQRAADQDRPLSDLIQDALAQYLKKDEVTSKERKIAFNLFCKQPMRLSARQLRQVLQEEVWDP
jgi:hypothetical protein